MLATTQKVPLNCAFLVELRGLEPQRLPAKTKPEMQLLASGVVTPWAIFLRIWVSVLRDVTVLA
jgi:hypothetical protein